MGLPLITRAYLILIGVILGFINCYLFMVRWISNFTTNESKLIIIIIFIYTIYYFINLLDWYTLDYEDFIKRVPSLSHILLCLSPYVVLFAFLYKTEHTNDYIYKNYCNGLNLDQCRDKHFNQYFDDGIPENNIDYPIDKFLEDCLKSYRNNKNKQNICEAKYKDLLNTE
jgi:hypothetical protein